MSFTPFSSKTLANRKKWLFLSSVLLVLFLSWFFFNPLVYNGSKLSFKYSRFSSIFLETIGENPLNVAGAVMCSAPSHEFKITYIYNVSYVDPVIITSEFISLLETQGNVINEKYIDEIINNNLFHVSDFDFVKGDEIVHISYAVLFEHHINEVYYFLCSSLDRDPRQI